MSAPRSFLLLSILLGIAFAFPISTLEATPAQDRGAVEQTPLIPREVFFDNPDRANPQLSPNGARIAYLAPVDGVMNVWVSSTKSPERAKPITEDRHRGIRNYFWAFDNEHVLYTQDANGDENWRVYSVQVDTRAVTDLTPYEGVAAQIQGVSHHFPNEVLVGLNDRDPQLHDLYRIDIRTGGRQLVEQNEGFIGMVTDDRFRVRFAQRFRPDGGMEVVQKAKGEGQWEEFMQVPYEDTMTTQIAGMAGDSQTLYYSDSRGRNTAALMAMDLDTGKSREIASDSRVDVGGAMSHPTEGTVEAVSFNYERVEWKVLDDAVRKDLKRLQKVEDGELSVTSRSLDDALWIAAFRDDDGPVKYYLWDRKEAQARFLFTNRSNLEGLPLAELRPVVIRARDGFKLVSYLTLPASHATKKSLRYHVKAAAHNRAAKRVPMVLLVHGGPWARDTWGYNSLHQFLANRGYAVLSVNFRGSTGFGKEFVNAADLEWAASMHDDLVDAVDWAVKEGFADPDKVAIMGGSYGGYATLVGLTFTPDLFACGVDIVGPSNLITLLNSIPPYWAPLRNMFFKRVGNPETEEGRRLLQERSPLSHVDRIQRPLLIGQGANDPRVKQAESDQIVAAMEQKDLPVTYVLFPDEGHGFRRPENSLAFFAVTEVFLAQHLGGRAQPIRSGDFEGSSIQVPNGAELVPGLAPSGE